MNKQIPLALLGVGVIMLALGLNASDSVSSGVSRFFNGMPSDKAVWLLIGGAICTLVGMGGLYRSTRKP